MRLCILDAAFDVMCEEVAECALKFEMLLTHHSSAVSAQALALILGQTAQKLITKENLLTLVTDSWEKWNPRREGGVG